MEDGGVLDYYGRMTDVAAFSHPHDMKERAYAIAKKTTDKIMKELGKRYPDVFETDGNEKVSEEEPLVERDFEG